MGEVLSTFEAHSSQTTGPSDFRYPDGEESHRYSRSSQALQSLRVLRSTLNDRYDDWREENCLEDDEECFEDYLVEVYGAVVAEDGRVSSREPARYDKEGDGQWKSLNGAAVLVGPEGQLLAGCPGLEGGDLDDLDEGREHREERHEQAEEAGWESQEVKRARQTHEQAKQHLGEDAQKFVVLTRLGDKAYAFSGDASILKDLTNVGDGETASFDVDKLDHHLSSLVKAGHRVAVVDRQEDGDPTLDSDLDPEAKDIVSETRTEKTHDTVDEISQILKSEMPGELHSAVDQAADKARESGNPFDLYDAFNGLDNQHRPSRAARHAMIAAITEHEAVHGQDESGPAEDLGSVPTGGTEPDVAGSPGIPEEIGTPDPSLAPAAGEPLGQRIGEKHANTGLHIAEAPTQVRDILTAMHGLRTTKRSGSSQTDDISPDYAKDIYDFLKSSKSGQYGQVHDLSSALGHGALGYQTPGGNLVMIPPKMKSDDWDIRYALPGEDVPHPSEMAGEETAEGSEEFFDFDVSDDQPSQPKPKGVNPSSRLGQAIIDAVGDDPQEQENFKQLVDQVWEKKRQEAAERAQKVNEVIENTISPESRRAFKNTIHALERSGRDYESLKTTKFSSGFDEMADYASRYAPELLQSSSGESVGRAVDPEQLLWDALTSSVRGTGPAKHSDDVIGDALEIYSHFEESGAEHERRLLEDPEYRSAFEELEATPFKREERKMRYRKWCQKHLNRWRRYSRSLLTEYARKQPKSMPGQGGLFEEEKHPRDEGGKFSTKPAASSPQSGDDEGFELRNDPQRPSGKKPEFENTGGPQQKMWTGLDLLSGQRDFLEEGVGVEKPTPPKQKTSDKPPRFVPRDNSSPIQQNLTDEQHSKLGEELSKGRRGKIGGHGLDPNMELTADDQQLILMEAGNLNNVRVEKALWGEEYDDDIHEPAPMKVGTFLIRARSILAQHSDQARGQKAIDAVGDAKTAVFEKKDDEHGRKLMLHPSTYEPGKWQLTSLDNRGPSGHSVHATKEKAVLSAVGAVPLGDGGADYDLIWHNLSGDPAPFAKESRPELYAKREEYKQLHCLWKDHDPIVADQYSKLSEHYARQLTLFDEDAHPRAKDQVTIEGHDYNAGQWIPKEKAEQATAAQQESIEVVDSDTGEVQDLEETTDETRDIIDFLKESMNSRGQFIDDDGNERGGDWFREELESFSEDDKKRGIDWLRENGTPAQQRWQLGAFSQSLRYPESSSDQEDQFFHGNKISLTGKVEEIHGGEFEEFVYLEGDNEGETGWRATKAQRDKTAAEKAEERKRQQESFAELHKPKEPEEDAGDTPGEEPDDIESLRSKVRELLPGIDEKILQTLNEKALRDTIDVADPPEHELADRFEDYEETAEKVGIEPQSKEDWHETQKDLAENSASAQQIEESENEAASRLEPASLPTEETIETKLSAGAIEPEQALEEFKITQNRFPEITPAEEDVIADFGEKSHSARKHTSRSTGPREKKEKDPRPAWARRYDVVKIDKSSRPDEEGKYQIYDTKKLSWYGQPRAVGKPFDTEEEATAQIPHAELKRNHGIKWEKNDDGTQEFQIYRKVSDRKLPVVRGGFSSREEAEQYMRENPEELITHKFPRFEDSLFLDHVEREGPKYRDGNVNPKQFESTFNIKGATFGKWLKGSEGQESLNHAWDGLHDLMDITGLTASQITMDGDLAIGFGSHGTGGKHAARAHYQPGEALINLTKMKGAGSFAHEWGHALDWNIGGGDPATGVKYYSMGRSKIPNELHEPIQQLRDAMFSKSVEKTRETAREQKSVDKITEHLQSKMDELEQDFVPNEWRKVKPWKSKEDEKRWNELKAQIVSADVGETVYAGGSDRGRGSGRMLSLGRSTFAPLEEMNKLYKTRTGRSFHTAADHSKGNSIYWTVKRAQDARTRLEEAQRGDTEVVKGRTNFMDESFELDKTRKSDYYTLPHEMFARAFEAYMQDKLESQGRKSQYMVARAKNSLILGGNPYPEGEERQQINAAFDRFFEAYRNHVGAGSASQKSSPKKPKPTSRDLKMLKKWQSQVATGKITQGEVDRAWEMFDHSGE